MDFALFIVPVVAAGVGASEHMERSEQTQFCLSCHIMEHRLNGYTGLTSKFQDFASMESFTCGCCGEALLGHRH